MTEAPLPPDPGPSGKKAAAFAFEVRTEMYGRVGVDLFRLPGFNEETVLRLLSETGRDLTRWPSEKHFASWLSVCPGTKAHLTEEWRESVVEPDATESESGGRSVAARGGECGTNGDRVRGLLPAQAGAERPGSGSDGNGAQVSARCITCW